MSGQFYVYGRSLAAPSLFFGIMRLFVQPVVPGKWKKFKIPARGNGLVNPRVYTLEGYGNEQKQYPKKIEYGAFV